jgi:hypothetical protein
MSKPKHQQTPPQSPHDPEPSWLFPILRPVSVSTNVPMSLVACVEHLQELAAKPAKVWWSPLPGSHLHKLTVFSLDENYAICRVRYVNGATAYLSLRADIAGSTYIMGYCRLSTFEAFMPIILVTLIGCALSYGIFIFIWALFNIPVTLYTVVWVSLFVGGIGSSMFKLLRDGVVARDELMLTLSDVFFSNDALPKKKNSP